MKQRVLQVITALLLIITLTMANFLLLGVNAISYAAETINAEKSTKHKNIEFMAYFKDEKGNKVTETESLINSNDLKLYFQISVNQEGYFNGNILLKDANFEFKSDLTSDIVNKIENNTIYLNQINAGETKEIEVGIELLKDEQFDLDLIDKESKVSIEGIYKNSTQKDISISSERNVTLNLINPYTNADESTILSQEIITNKILEFNGEEKRVIQIQVKSGLNDNLFPVKMSSINIQTPKISDIYPESVLVSSNDTLVTNGKMLSQDNWNYDSESGLITINVENKAEDNKVSWVKNGEDKLIVTYIFNKEVELDNNKMNVNSKIELYDVKNTIIENFSEIQLNDEEKDSTVTTVVNQNEASIYKGKLYSGISRDITYMNTINVNLNNVASEINIKENQQTISEEINSVYKTTKISKSNLENVLGENGTLNIINADTGITITTINKNAEADENGNIIVSYPENVKTIIINIKSPEKIGKLEIESTKTIKSVNKTTIKEANNINSKISVSYISNNKENVLEGTESNIELKETVTTADLQINRTELSAMTQNNNVEFRITLNSKDESSDLFKNPVLKIELPEKIEDIQVNSIDLLYEDELKIKSAVLNNKTIEIALEGEQTKYKDQAIDGAIIIINANLATSKKIASSTEQVKLIYSNENATNYKDGASIGTDVKDISIVSYVGVVTTNQIAEYGLEVINNEGINTANLELSAETKNVTIEKKIINNKENKISNVKVLGVFPTKDAVSNVNNIDILINSGITVSGIDASRFKIYYSNNANATEDLEEEGNGWTDNIEDNKNVKKYLVVIDGLDILEEVDLSYEIVIPANLEYNESAEEGYTVYYTDDMTTNVRSVELANINLSTGKGAVVETELKALVGGQEAKEVKPGEIIRYAVTVSNTGSEDVENIKVIGTVPNGTSYVEISKVPNEENSNVDLENFDPISKNTEISEYGITFERVKQGESKTAYYEVIVEDGTVGTNISNKLKTTYGEVTKESNEVTNTVVDGDLKLSLYSVDDDGEITVGYTYRYIVNVTNTSNIDKQNVKVNIVADDIFDIQSISYLGKDGSYVMENQSNSIVIDNLEAGSSMKVGISILAKGFFDSDEKTLSMVANVVDNNKTYNSNQLTINAKSSNLTFNVVSDNAGEYVQAGQILEYKINLKNNGTNATNNLKIKNIISNDVSLKEIRKNGNVLAENSYTVTDNSTSATKSIEINDNLNAGESAEYVISVVVNYVQGDIDAAEIINETVLYANEIELGNATTKHVLTQKTDNGNNAGNDESDNENDDEDVNSDENNSGNAQVNNTKVISGTAWLDENENGQLDSDEELLKDITVRLLDVENNQIVEDEDGEEILATTNSEGFYSLNNIPEGEYLVIFEYDTTKYILTAYEKDGVLEKDSSKAISKTLTIDGEETLVGCTEVIKIKDNNIGNINIGLQEAKIFDLKLDKYISKVTIQNSKGTVTNEYDNATIAKGEIDAKLVNGTTAVVEYKIKVTNEGEVEAYAKKIVDYLSSDYKFSSNLNKDWYQSEGMVYNTSLANEKILPGESKEVTLVVTKQMTENNTGLITNTAEIVESYNEYGLSDTDSTVANKVNSEDDMASADLILSIKTGEIVATISLIISTIVILGAATYVITRIILRRKVL